ncbi:MAG TPA: hypothetical protein VMZ53_09870 [Kofleriaceae bacterium]|nr:hypothetical protein [Kofleriaceae bacterium]
MRRLAVLLIAACSSPAPPAEHPTETPPATPEPRQDAAAEPDAGPPQAVLDAPAWVFRYSTKDRAETWTLRHAEGSALLVVETAQGAQRYTGTATDGETLKLDVSTGTAKMTLDCKRAKRPLSAKCNDQKAKPIEVLECFHPDFKTPMPFGPAPGVEYAVDASCNGYRLVPKP